MTSTLGPNWSPHSVHKIVFDKSRTFWNGFRRTMHGVVIKKAPEYLPFFLSMPSQMVNVLRETLLHWHKSPHIPSRYRRRFLEAKLIECLAFWKGYSDMGGEFLLRINSTNVSPPALFPRHISSLPTKKNNRLQILVVIPIGSLSPKIDEILALTLSACEENASISKIVCIFDGIKTPENWHKSIYKLEIHQLSHRSGPAHARNIGIEIALQNDSITDVLLLDSDIIMSSQNLTAFLTQYQRLPECGIACPKIIANGTTWTDHYQNLSGTLNGRYLRSGQDKQLLFGTTSCMIIPREVMQKGLQFSCEFPIAAGEDIDFCLKAYRYGCQIYALDSISIPHWYGTSGDDQQNWVTFKERFYRYGKGEALVLKHHPYYYHLLKNSHERI